MNPSKIPSLQGYQGPWSYNILNLLIKVRVVKLGWTPLLTVSMMKSDIKYKFHNLQLNNSFKKIFKGLATLLLSPKSSFRGSQMTTLAVNILYYNFMNNNLFALISVPIWKCNDHKYFPSPCLLDQKQRGSKYTL